MILAVRLSRALLLTVAALLLLMGIRAKPALASRFLQRKMDEYEAMKAEIDALQAELPK